MLRFECTQESLRPAPSSWVQWLDIERDFPLADVHWRALGGMLRKEDWRKWHDQGYKFCAVVEDGAIAAIGAVWRWSGEAWEVAAVHTRERFRRRGLARAVVSFLTEHILSSGRTATCHTDPGNTGMIKTAESVGFRRCQPPRSTDASAS